MFKVCFKAPLLHHGVSFDGVLPYGNDSSSLVKGSGYKEEVPYPLPLVGVPFAFKHFFLQRLCHFTYTHLTTPS